MGSILIWKLYVSCPLALAFIVAYFLHRSRRNHLFMIAGIIYCLADILINPSIALGIGVFAVGHVINIVNFCLEHKPEKKQLILIAAICAVFIAAALIIVPLIPNPKTKSMVEPLILPIIVYAVILVTAVIFSKKDRALTFAGMLVFFASDVFLAVNTVVNASRPVRITMLVIYYIAIALLVLSRLIPEKKQEPLLSK